MGIVPACAGQASSPADQQAASRQTATSVEAPPPGLTPEAEPTEADPSEPAAVRIERSRFGPREITVGVGEQVTFVNDDPFAHTVTARPDSGVTFDSGGLDQDMEFTVEFDEPGTYAYFCAIHPTMRGTIVVE